MRNAARTDEGEGVVNSTADNAWTLLIESTSLRDITASHFPDRGAGLESAEAVSVAPTLPAAPMARRDYTQTLRAAGVEPKEQAA